MQATPSGQGVRLSQAKRSPLKSAEYVHATSPAAMVARRRMSGIDAGAGLLAADLALLLAVGDRLGVVAGDHAAGRRAGAGVGEGVQFPSAAVGGRRAGARIRLARVSASMAAALLVGEVAVDLARGVLALRLVAGQLAAAGVRVVGQDAVVALVGRRLVAGDGRARVAGVRRLAVRRSARRSGRAVGLAVGADRSLEVRRAGGEREKGEHGRPAAHASILPRCDNRARWEEESSTCQPGPAGAMADEEAQERAATNTRPAAVSPLAGVRHRAPGL